MAKPRILAEHLIVEPPIDHTPPEPPFLTELRRRNALVLRPLVDCLRLEAQIGRHFLYRKDLILEVRSIPPTIGHRSGRFTPVSTGDPKRSSMTVDGSVPPSGSAAFSPPVSNLFIE